MDEIKIAQYRSLDPFFDGNNDENSMPLDIVEERRVKRDALWASMTDEERAEVGAPRVECAVCKCDYGQSGVGEKTQGDRCASAVRASEDGRTYVTCHYGSDFGGNAYEVVGGMDDEADPVCDTCLRRWIAQGRIVFVGDFLHDKSVSSRVFGD